MGTKLEISVVVPLYNEAGNVQPLARKILDALASSGSTIEVLLVDDASTDDTWREIQRAQDADSRIRGIRHPENMGQSAALFTGFRVCQAPVVATLDGDLQNDPADLPRMISELWNCDMVCGVRVARADNWLRRASSKIARWTRKLALRVDYADTGCNLRVFKKTVLQAIPAFKGVHRFMPVLAHNAGAIVKEVPVSHHPRVSGVSKYGVWNRLGRGIFDLLMVALFLRRQLKLEPAAMKTPAGRNSTGKKDVVCANLMLLLAFLLLSAGYKSIGPGTIPRDRYNYSGSISESWKRQTLLNIFQLRYLDPPIFVDVEPIVAGHSLETSGNAGGRLSSAGAIHGNSLSFGGSATFTG